MRDAVQEDLAEARRAVVADAGHHVTLRREHLRVPAVMPVVAGPGVRAAVDVVQQRVLLLRVEARRVDQPHLHVVAFDVVAGSPGRVRPLEPDLFDPAQGQRGYQAVVEGLDAPRCGARQVGVQSARMLR